MQPSQPERSRPGQLGLVRDLVIAVALLALGLVLVIYNQNLAKTISAERESAAANASVATTPMGEAEPGSIQEQWENSPHYTAFVVSDEEKNRECTQCHSPIVYVPTMDEMPASCAVCKFEVKTPPEFVSEEAWQPIDCKTCHRVTRDGEVQPEIQWLEAPAIEQYQTVSTTTELCQKCHSGTRHVGHVDVTLGGAHPDQTCTDCHNAHSAESSCLASGCHDSREATDGHDEAHQNVNCVACHDSSGLAVGPDEERAGQWVTFAADVTGAEEAVPYLSHVLEREVNCDRCHYEGNPWGLTVE